MSLMNDALRKKNREHGGAAPSAEVSLAPPAPPRSTRKWLILLAALMVSGSAVLYGIHLRHPTGKASLAVKRPFSARTGQPAGPPAEKSSASVQQAKTGFAPTESIQHATPAPTVPRPSASVMAANEQPSPLPSIVPAETPDAEGTTKTSNFSLEGNPAALVGLPPQADRAIEPGPDPAVPPRHPAPTASPRSRPPVTPATANQAPSPGPSRPATQTRSATISDTALFYRKALACHRSGRLAQAEHFYRSVLKTDANHSEAMFNLAAVYIAEDRFNQAHPLLKRLENITPRPDGVLLNLAITAIGRGAPQAALDYLDRAEAAADAVPRQIHFHRAVALSRLNRFSEALDFYRQVEIERPDDYRVQFNMAVTHDSLEDYPQALYYYEKVLEAPSQASENDRQSISRRMGRLRRYLTTTQSQVKRQ